MEKYLITVITLGLLFFTLNSFSQAASDHPVAEKNKREQDIRNVIADETKAFLKKDSIKLFSFYSDDELTQNVWNNQNGTYTVVKGKEQITKSLSTAIRRRPLQTILPDIERVNWFFRHLSEEYMWVNFDQILQYKDGKKLLTYEIRLMKLEKSGWKTTATIALTDHEIK